MRVALGTTKNIQAHVGKIREQVVRGLEDGEARQLAVKIVSGRFEHGYVAGQEALVVRAYGQNFLAPPGPVCRSRDDACEIERIWDFVVLNIRYVYDPAEIDTFATLEESLKAGGGDCDDLTAAVATLLGAIGFTVVARVIHDKGSPQDWDHIYPLVGIGKDDPTRWVPLDATVEGATPGWEYQSYDRKIDLPLVGL